MTTPRPDDRGHVAAFERQIAADPALQERPAQAALDYAFGIYPPQGGAEQADKANALMEQLQPIVARYEQDQDFRLDRARDILGNA